MTRAEYEAALHAVHTRLEKGEIDKREAHAQSLDLFRRFWKVQWEEREKQIYDQGFQDGLDTPREWDGE